MNENPMNDFSNQDNQPNNPANNIGAGPLPGAGGQEQAPPPPSPSKMMADKMAADLKKCAETFERSKAIAEELKKRGDIAPEVVDVMKKNAEEQMSNCVDHVTRKYRSATESAFSGSSQSQYKAPGGAPNLMNKLFRSELDKMIAGVCGGLGEYFRVDSSVIRVLFVLLSLWPFPGFSVLIYIVLAVILPLKTASGEMRKTF